MKLLNRAVDFLQAQFPPNRIVVLLGGLLTAVSATVSAWLAAHFPGLNLGTAEVAGVLGAAALITIRLLDRWIDQWQRQEPVDYQADLEAALDELADDPTVQDILANLGSVEQAAAVIADLRASVEAGTLQPADIATGLGHIGDALGEFLHNVNTAQAPAAPAPAPSPTPTA